MPIPPFDVTIKGVALETVGHTAYNTWDALGLLTDGLIWTCANEWFGPYYTNGLTVSSSWTLSGNATVSTSWSLIASATVSTGWTIVSGYGVENC